MSYTVAGLVARECAKMSPAMFSAALGSAVMPAALVGGCRVARVRATVCGGALVAVGTGSLVGVYSTSSRILCFTAIAVAAVGWSLYSAGRFGSPTRPLESSLVSLVWIAGPVASSSLYYDHLRTSVLLPSLIAVALIGATLMRSRHGPSTRSPPDPT
ncbi:MAG TPA: hypothetical protein VH370_13740 [Humisphaera sp.]|nr:hypothetical protein [Humisphaera sp.]